MSPNKTQIRTARKIANAADEGGTIQARDMVRLFPGEPRKHTASTLRQAWAWAMPGADLDALAESVWG